MKCRSGKHEWTDPADAAKCCNGWTRRLRVGMRDGVPWTMHYWSRDEPVHAIGCVCEACSAAYERDRWDPRDRVR